MMGDDGNRLITLQCTDSISKEKLIGQVKLSVEQGQKDILCPLCKAKMPIVFIRNLGIFENEEITRIELELTNTKNRHDRDWKSNVKKIAAGLFVCVGVGGVAYFFYRKKTN